MVGFTHPTKCIEEGGMVAISLDQIEAVTKTALMHHGATDWIAAEVARAVRKAESVGNKICGLYYLES